MRCCRLLLHLPSIKVVLTESESPYDESFYYLGRHHQRGVTFGAKCPHRSDVYVLFSESIAASKDETRMLVVARQPPLTEIPHI